MCVSVEPRRRETDLRGRSDSRGCAKNSRGFSPDVISPAGGWMLLCRRREFELTGVACTDGAFEHADGRDIGRHGRTR